MKVYKLTDQDNMTMNKTLWGPGVTHTASGEGELCSSGWLHAYSHPLIAAFMNPIHANITNPRLWEAEGSGFEKDDRGLKMGFQELKTIREIPMPEPTTTQRVAFGILYTMKVCHNSAFVEWANGWLSGEDRSAHAASAAYAGVSAARDARAAAYAAYAGSAARAGAYAASAVADAAAYAAAAAAYAADAVDAASVDAAWAARAVVYAADAADDIDLIAIAEEAMGY